PVRLEGRRVEHPQQAVVYIERHIVQAGRPGCHDADLLCAERQARIDAVDGLRVWRGDDQRAGAGGRGSGLVREVGQQRQVLLTRPVVRLWRQVEEDPRLAAVGRGGAVGGQAGRGVDLDAAVDRVVFR